MITICFHDDELLNIHHLGIMYRKMHVDRILDLGIRVLLAFYLYMKEIIKKQLVVCYLYFGLQELLDFLTFFIYNM